MCRYDHNECCGHSNDRIGAEIGMLHNLLRRQMACMTEKSADSANVTGMQAMIVHHLILREKEGDLFQKDIESAFQMRRSTATGILQLMEQHGILRREPVAHDGRLKRLVLTDRARAMDERITERMAQRAGFPSARKFAPIWSSTKEICAGRDRKMVKQLLKSVREFKKDALLTPLFVVLEVVMEVLIPFVMAELIDKGIDAQNMSAIGKYGFILVACAMLALVFGAAAGTYAARASTGFARNLRHDMYYAVQDFSFSNIDKFSTGSIVTRLTTDVTNVQNAFQMCTRIAVRCPVMLIFAFVMAAKINRNMALIFVAVLPVLAIGLGILMKMVGPVFERVFKIYDRLNTVVQENVHGIRVVKAYVREDHETEKFENVSELLYRTFSKAQKTLACNMPLMQFCMYACMLLISWFGARLIVGGSMTTGELTSMFSYIMQILMSLMMVAMVFVMITMAKASAERVAELLSEKPDLHNPAQPVCEVKDGSIDFDAVDFSYKGDEHKLALRDVNLHIRSGQTIGILGGTGSAKSTLVQLIPRLYDVTRGSVKVGGVDVRDYDIETLRDEVAMVLQKNVLFSGTIKENLRWGNENASDDELVRVCRLAQADEFIQQMPDQYDTHIEQGGSNVSGGQKQRLCIARALLKKPKILILDDSTSAVDTNTDALIRRAFAEEIPNTTKIIIAQRVSSVQEADQIVILDGGAVQAIGTHDELLAENQIYQEIYNQQNRKGGEE